MNELKKPILPNRNLLKKWYFQLFFVYISMTASFLILFGILGIIGSLVDPSGTWERFFTALIIGAFFWILLSVIFFLPLTLVLLILWPKYFATFEYRLTEDHVEVHKGLINKSVKFVPYRTMTNTSTVYGFFDRIFGIGSVIIETAGAAGPSVVPEERLLGLKNPHEVQENVLERIHRFRTPMATMTETPEDLNVLVSTNDRLDLIRRELIMIRKLLEKNGDSSSKIP